MPPGPPRPRIPGPDPNRPPPPRPRMSMSLSRMSMSRISRSRSRRSRSRSWSPPTGRMSASRAAWSISGGLRSSEWRGRPSLEAAQGTVRSVPPTAGRLSSPDVHCSQQSSGTHHSRQGTDNQTDGGLVGEKLVRNGHGKSNLVALLKKQTKKTEESG